MKHIAKKISCIALTAALLAGGMPVQVLADSPKTQQEQPGEVLPQEVLPEEIQPEPPEQEGTGSVLPDGESQMQEETHKPQEPPQEVPQEQTTGTDTGTDRRSTTGTSGRRDCRTGRTETAGASGRYARAAGG